MIGYDLEKTIEAPYMGLRIATWTPSSGQFPQAGQRVIWMAPNGRQIRGTYQGANQWDADPIDDRDSHRIKYTPSIWRPA